MPVQVPGTSYSVPEVAVQEILFPILIRAPRHLPPPPALPDVQLPRPRGARWTRDDRAPARAARVLVIGAARAGGARVGGDRRGDGVTRSVPHARATRTRCACADVAAAARTRSAGRRTGGTCRAAARRHGKREDARLPRTATAGRARGRQV